MPQQANATADDGAPSTSYPKFSVPPDNNSNRGGTYAAEEKEEPLKTRQPGLWSRARLLGPLEKERGDAALLVHSFVTGLVDAGSFANWGVFVGMQTGKLVFFFEDTFFVLFCFSLAFVSFGSKGWRRGRGWLG